MLAGIARRPRRPGAAPGARLAAATAGCPAARLPACWHARTPLTLTALAAAGGWLQAMELCSLAQQTGEVSMDSYHNLKSSAGISPPRMRGLNDAEPPAASPPPATPSANPFVGFGDEPAVSRSQSAGFGAPQHQQQPSSAGKGWDAGFGAQPSAAVMGVPAEASSPSPAPPGSGGTVRGLYGSEAQVRQRSTAWRAGLWPARACLLHEWCEQVQPTLCFTCTCTRPGALASLMTSRHT